MTYRPLAALAVAALIAGCGNAPDETTTATSTQTSVASPDKAVQFAECMRKHGSADFPDPGGSDQAFAEGIERAAKNSAVFDKALDACKDLRPPGLLGAKRTAKQQDAGLKFAQCIRDNGVKDFPDPVDGEPLVNTYLIPSTDKPGGMDILNAAMETCKDLGAAAIEGR